MVCLKICTHARLKEIKVASLLGVPFIYKQESFMPTMSSFNWSRGELFLRAQAFGISPFCAPVVDRDWLENLGIAHAFPFLRKACVNSASLVLMEENLFAPTPCLIYTFE